MHRMRNRSGTRPGAWNGVDVQGESTQVSPVSAARSGGPRGGGRFAACSYVLRAAAGVSLCATLAACGGSPAAPTRTAQSALAVRVIIASSAPPSASGSPSPSSSPSPGIPRPPRKCVSPPLISHRGDGAPGVTAFPENTSAAELDAVRHGTSMMNVDVRWTADDVPVAIHDSTLDRTTSAAGHDVPVLSVTGAQFTALWARNNNGTPYAGHIHPQTLAQLLAGVKGTGLPIVLQMEADPFGPGGRGQASIDALAAVISASGYAGETVVGGWTAADVRAFASAAPGVRTALIQEALSPSAAPAATTVAASGAHILYVDFRGVTAAAVAAYHQAGLSVWAWTPAFPQQWTALRTAGVDAIATNWVPSYVQWAGGRCAAVLS